MAGIKQPRSLKARALQWLAQREHSRVELRRKLMQHALAEDAALAESGSPSSGAPGDTPNSTPDPVTAAAMRVEEVLDWLEAREYLSAARFIESRVNARAGRFGNLRIRQELKQHQLALTPDAAQALRESELQRARSVRDQKFANRPVDAADRARQARFLAGRGFSPDVISRVLRESADPADDAI